MAQKICVFLPGLHRNPGKVAVPLLHQLPVLLRGGDTGVRCREQSRHDKHTLMREQSRAELVGVDASHQGSLLRCMAALFARAVSVQADGIDGGGKLIAEIAAAGRMQRPAALIQIDDGSTSSCSQVSAAVQRVADDRRDARNIASGDALRAANLVAQEER